MNIIKLNRFLKQSYCFQSCAVHQFSQRHQELSSSSTSYSKPAPDQKPNWNRAVSEAEKIVGYPTSFFNLRWLLNDEVANVALHLRKLVGSNHPLLKTAKNLLYNGRNTMQAWGLIVLLLSKAAGHSPNIPDLEQDKAAGVLHSQRALAEITEMIRTSQHVHRSLINLRNYTEDKDGDLLFGNKISLLSGDYLLSTSCYELAGLKNQELVELIGAALRDQSEAEFVGPRDNQNFPLPAKPKTLLKQTQELIGEPNIEPLAVTEALGDARAEWTLRNVLSAGSLLGKSCQGTLKLAGHPIEMQEQGYLFGKHLALAWQACLDLEPFQGERKGTFSLVSAPVMFQLENDPTLYKEIEKGQESILNVDFDLIHKAVLSGPGLEKTKALQKEHSQAALDVLKLFPKSDARTALTNIIVAMQDL